MTNLKPLFNLLPLCVLLALLLLHALRADEQLDSALAVDSQDSAFYLGRVNAHLQGDGVTNPFCYEDRHLPTARPAYLESLIGYLGDVLGLSLYPLYGFMTLFGVLFLFLVWEGLFKEWGMQDVVASCSSVVLITTVFEHNLFRPVHPQLSAPLFYLLILMMLKTLRQPRVWKWVVLTCLVTVQAYTYTPFWVFSLLWLFFLVVLDLKQGRLALLKVLLASLVLAMPAFWHLLETSQHEHFTDLVFRLGRASSTPTLTLSLYVAIALTFFVIKDIGARRVALSLLIAGLVAANLQVITGTDMLSSRSAWYLGRPFCVFLGLLFLDALMRQRVRLHGAVFVSLIVASVCVFSVKDRMWFENQGSRFIEADRADYVLSALHSHLNGGAVVHAPLHWNNRLRLSGPWYSYVSMNHHATLMKQEDYELRWHASHFLDGLSPESFKKMCEEKPEVIANRYFGNHFHFQHGSNAKVSKDLIKVLIQKYGIYFKVNQTSWQPDYRLDAIILRKDTGINRRLLVGWQMKDSWGDEELWLRVP